MSDGMTMDTTLKSLFDTLPAVIPVFLRHRLSCVGCSMSAFDTLADALANYHLDGSSFLSDLVAAVNAGSEPETTSPA